MNIEARSSRPISWAIVALLVLLLATASVPVQAQVHSRQDGIAPAGHGNPLNDTTPPKINITQPKDGSKVFGTIVVSANATDDTGVAYVEFRLDSTLRLNLSQAPYNWTWDTKDTPNGTHVINATAYDAAGNFNWSKVSVIVDNDYLPPSVSIISPNDGATITGDIQIIANASDDHGNISKVVFSVDGKIRHIDNSPAGPYKWLWNATQEKNGQHTINVTAYDKWDHNASKQITVNVQVKDVIAPVVKVDSPSASAEVFDVVVVEFTVQDNVAIKKVELFLDFISKYFDNTGKSGTHNWTWDTKSFSNGVHVLNASAEDTSGNKAWDSIIVKVANLPGPQITSPEPEDKVMGTVLIQGTADPLLITEVRVKIDNGLWNTANGTAKWKIYWNTTKVGNGPHNISARGTDGIKFSATVIMKVYVDNPPLECIIITPIEGAKVSGEVNISGTASNGTARVEVTIDGSNWTTAAGSTSWYIFWNTKNESNGKHTVSARAYNGIWSNYTPIFSVNVNVSNEAKTNGSGIDPQVAGGIVALLAVILILMFLYTLGKRKPAYQEEEFEKEGPEEEEREPKEEGKEPEEKTGPKKGAKKKRVKDIEKS
jgi:hypothetical protein